MIHETLPIIYIILCKKQTVRRKSTKSTCHSLDDKYMKDNRVQMNGCGPFRLVVLFDLSKS